MPHIWKMLSRQVLPGEKLDIVGGPAETSNSTDQHPRPEHVADGSICVTACNVPASAMATANRMQSIHIDDGHQAGIEVARQHPDGECDESAGNKFVKVQMHCLLDREEVKQNCSYNTENFIKPC